MQTALTVRRWSRLEYERLAASGFFHDEPVELIGGQLIVAEAQSTSHATAIGIVDDVLRESLPPGWIVRSQAPVSLDEESAPEPDIAVVRGARRDYLNAHPSLPALVVEVADSSLGFDRRIKGSVYARGGVQDYWIVNVAERALEVYRDPQADSAVLGGWSYRSVRKLRATDSVAPLSLPSVTISVGALLLPGA